MSVEATFQERDTAWDWIEMINSLFQYIDRRRPPAMAQVHHLILTPGGQRESAIVQSDFENSAFVLYVLIIGDLDS